jgi:hypothetical protein
MPSELKKLVQSRLSALQHELGGQLPPEAIAHFRVGQRQEHVPRTIEEAVVMAVFDPQLLEIRSIDLERFGETPPVVLVWLAKRLDLSNEELAQGLGPAVWSKLFTAAELDSETPAWPDLCRAHPQAASQLLRTDATDPAAVIETLTEWRLFDFLVYAATPERPLMGEFPDYHNEERTNALVAASEEHWETLLSSKTEWQEEPELASDAEARAERAWDQLDSLCDQLRSRMAVVEQRPSLSSLDNLSSPPPPPGGSGPGWDL